MMISPGSSPGSWSPSPWKTIFWPSLIPVAVQWPGLFCSSLILNQSQIHQLSPHSHLCRCGPPRSSSVAGSSGLRMLCSGPCGLFSVLGPDSCGTLWTLAGPYLVLAGAHGPACLCHGKSCTSVQLLSDSLDLTRERKKRKKVKGYLCVLDLAYFQAIMRLMCFVIGQRAFLWLAWVCLNWKASLGYLTSPVMDTNESI